MSEHLDIRRDKNDKTFANLLYLQSLEEAHGLPSTGRTTWSDAGLRSLAYALSKYRGDIQSAAKETGNTVESVKYIIRLVAKISQVPNKPKAGQPGAVENFMRRYMPANIINKRPGSTNEDEEA